jgi:hypothetical protein
MRAKRRCCVVMFAGMDSAVLTRSQTIRSANSSKTIAPTLL